MKHSRRDFIKSALSTSAFLSLPYLGSSIETSKNKRNFGVILGLLKRELEMDYLATLKLISELGYKEVEFGGTYGQSKEDFKNALSEYGLKAVAGGSSMASLQDKLDDFIDDAHYFGKKYVICYWPWLDGGTNKNLDDFKEAAERLNKLGERIAASGLRFAFHNHDKEFVELGNDVLGYDVLLQETNPDIVDMEIDLYWIVKGNADPVRYFDDYPGRFKICHVKDMDNTPDRSFEIVGNGIIDFQRIFNKAEKAGLGHFIVEHDKAPEPVKTVTESIRYLKNLSF